MSVSPLLVILSVVSTLKQTQDTQMSIIIIMTETSHFVDSYATVFFGSMTTWHKPTINIDQSIF